MQILANYRDRYLKDAENFPGGCVFVTFSVEFDNLYPHLAQEVNKGFIGFKAMLGRLLRESEEKGELRGDVNIGTVAEMLFAGMLGASVIYGLDKSATVLDQAIAALMDYLEKLKS